MSWQKSGNDVKERKRNTSNHQDINYWYILMWVFLLFRLSTPTLRPVSGVTCGHDQMSDRNFRATRSDTERDRKSNGKQKIQIGGREDVKGQHWVSCTCTSVRVGLQKWLGDHVSSHTTVMSSRLISDFSIFIQDMKQPCEVSVHFSG